MYVFCICVIEGFSPNKILTCNGHIIVLVVSGAMVLVLSFVWLVGFLGLGGLLLLFFFPGAMILFCNLRFYSL